MDKYQISFLKDIIISADNADGCGNFEIDNEGNLIVVQNENYKITNYNLKIKNKDFASVSYYANAWKKVNVESDVINVPIDFNNPTTIIKLELKNGVVDNFDISVSLKKADEEAWNIKCENIENKKRLKNMELVLNSAETLHTVIFKPCCNDYSYTIVKWYAISKYKRPNYEGTNYCISGGGDYGHNKQVNFMSDTFIEECKLTDKFYCNNVCAYDVAAEVTQFDKNGKELISVRIGFKN